MKRLFLLISLFFLASLYAFSQGVNKVIPARPNPPKLVNDFAHVLTPEQVQALENKLVAYDDSTSSQIAVVTMTSTQDYPIEEVALGILRQWGVGGKEHNNGIVLLVSVEDRKVRIETGYGLEGAVPDITANSIIEHDIVPAFKEGNYYRGLDAATNSIIEAAAGEYKAPEGYADRGNRGGGISLGKIILGIIILWIILGVFGSGGGRGGGFASRRGYRGFGGPIIFPGSFGHGGGFGGGGFGGGGGGFGGFGGGGGGGGGASGSW